MTTKTLKPKTVKNKAGESLVVQFGDRTKPLMLGDIEVPCYVLNDKQRVLTLTGMLSALGMKKGTAGGGDELNRLAKFSAGNAVRQYVSGGMMNLLNTPLKFELPNSGGIAYGFEATLLIDLCQSILHARAAGSLRANQLHIAANCEIILVSVAKVGIISLVDEVTGFQKHRADDALQHILEDFIANEARKWERAFPEEYFREMCRLRDVEFNAEMRFPPYFGGLVRDTVYSRLAPGVMQGLYDHRQKGEKLHQWLTEQFGCQKLQQHLGVILGLMTISKTWPEFIHNLNRVRPPYSLERSLFDRFPWW